MTFAFMFQSSPQVSESILNQPSACQPARVERRTWLSEVEVDATDALKGMESKIKYATG